MSLFSLKNVVYPNINGKQADCKWGKTPINGKQADCKRGKTLITWNYQNSWDKTCYVAWLYHPVNSYWVGQVVNWDN